MKKARLVRADSFAYPSHHRNSHTSHIISKSITIT